MLTRDAIKPIKLSRTEFRLSLKEAFELYTKHAGKSRKNYGELSDFVEWITKSAKRYIPIPFEKVLICPEGACIRCFKGEFHYKDQCANA
jgi:hypothetical protein